MSFRPNRRITDMGPVGAHDPQSPRLFLTASEAYPALEQLFLEARSDISMGYRVFDPDTRLHSEAARAIGDTWSDLLAHTLARGVSIRLLLSDFDVVVAPDLHRMTWRAVAGIKAAGQASGRPDLLTVLPALHPARIGWVPRAFMWSKIVGNIRTEAARLNALPVEAAQDDLVHMPAILPYLRGKHPHLQVKTWPIPAIVPVTHHQKLAVFDGQRLFIGGLDLNDRRYDTPEHDRPADQTWHDTQILVDGPVAAEARAHLNEVTAVANGDRTASRMQHLLRTLSAKHPRDTFRMSPAPVDTGLERAHLQHIKQACRLIYFESQFMRSVPLARALARAARANPDLHLLLVLPGAPDDVAFEGNKKSDARYGEYLQAKCVRLIRSAFKTRCFIMAPAQPKRTYTHGRSALKGAPLVYLHAKVSIFDDEAAIISSANLNGRSLRWDTEAGVMLTDSETVDVLRRRCFQHWLPEDAPDAAFDPKTAVESWRNMARDNAARAPEDRQGFVLSYPVSPARRFGRNLPGVPEELV
ncbi:phospholipase D-like domain-containing protein [Rhodobacteraceae bacterium KMM 6894]|nr:phospholipase D-like domain-containing protein [Rhodobacteraceae bacterium KMM 6894]